MSNAVSNIQLIMLAEGLILNLRTIFLLALDWFKKKKTIEKGILMRISQLSVAFAYHHLFMIFYVFFSK